tara:strand:- start:404 stop:604 length:201 start_codon:yes stop_codon:yes gene_type:complete
MPKDRKPYDWKIGIGYDKLRKDSYGKMVPKDITHNQYWEDEKKAEELSYKESIRQRDERLKRNKGK